jgi:hypothetical protein
MTVPSRRTCGRDTALIGHALAAGEVDDVLLRRPQATDLQRTLDLAGGSAALRQTLGMESGEEAI